MITKLPMTLKDNLVLEIRLIYRIEEIELILIYNLDRFLEVLQEVF